MTSSLTASESSSVATNPLLSPAQPILSSGDFLPTLKPQSADSERLNTLPRVPLPSNESESSPSVSSILVEPKEVDTLTHQPEQNKTLNNQQQQQQLQQVSLTSLSQTTLSSSFTTSVLAGQVPIPSVPYQTTFQQQTFHPPRPQGFFPPSYAPTYSSPFGSVSQTPLSSSTQVPSNFSQQPPLPLATVASTQYNFSHAPPSSIPFVSPLSTLNANDNNNKPDINNLAQSFSSSLYVNSFSSVAPLQPTIPPFPSVGSSGQNHSFPTAVPSNLPPHSSLSSSESVYSSVGFSASSENQYVSMVPSTNIYTFNPMINTNISAYGGSVPSSTSGFPTTHAIPPSSVAFQSSNYSSSN